MKKITFVKPGEETFSPVLSVSSFSTNVAYPDDLQQFSRNIFGLTSKNKISIFDMEKSKCVEVISEDDAKKLQIWPRSYIYLAQVASEYHQMWSKDKGSAQVSAFEITQQRSAFFTIFPDEKHYLKVHNHAMSLHHKDNMTIPLATLSHEGKVPVSYEMVVCEDGKHFITSTRFIVEHQKRSYRSLCNESALTLWDIENLQSPVMNFNSGGSYHLNQLTVLPNQHQFLTAKVGAVQSDILLWDINYKDPIAAFKTEKHLQNSVVKILPLPDGVRFIAHYEGYGAWLWNVRFPNNPEAIIRYHSFLDFSYLDPNGQYCHVEGRCAGNASVTSYELACVQNWQAEIYKNLIDIKIPPHVDKMIVDYAMNSIHDRLQFFKKPIPKEDGVVESKKRKLLS
jgi:WD40 repeat protein